MNASTPSGVGTRVPVAPPARQPSEARERILATAYRLFARRGIRAVGVDLIIEESGVAKQTFYRHFPSKEQLVLAFLDRREQVWTQHWLARGVYERALDPAERLLAIFDLFDSWFQEDDFEGCPFISVMLEMGPRAELGKACSERLAAIRSFVLRLTTEAGARDSEQAARQIQMLMQGAIVARTAGDREAARRMKEVARLILRQQLDPPASQ